MKYKVKNNILLLPIAILMVLTYGCSKSNEQSSSDDASRMYNELKKLVISSTDSLKSASDSTSVATAVENYEKLLTKIIMHYPAQTDMRLSQGQQDTLAQLTEKFVSLHREKNHRLTLSTDTLPSDTIPLQK